MRSRDTVVRSGKFRITPGTPTAIARWCTRCDTTTMSGVLIAVWPQSRRTGEFGSLLEVSHRQHGGSTPALGSFALQALSNGALTDSIWGGPMFNLIAPVRWSSLLSSVQQNATGFASRRNSASPPATPGQDLHQIRRAGNCTAAPESRRGTEHPRVHQLTPAPRRRPLRVLHLRRQKAPSSLQPLVADQNHLASDVGHA